MPALSRYADNLLDQWITGTGVHSRVMSTANLGVLAGLPPQQIYDDLWGVIPKDRKNPEREIQDAINKALSDHHGGTFKPRPRPAPIVQNGTAARQRIIDGAKIVDEADLWEASPLRLWVEPKDDAALLLETLFRPDDQIWIGDRHQAGIIGDTIRTTAEWITYICNGGKPGPFIIINPLNGTPTTTKAGDKTTLRGDGNVASYPHCMAEFDTLSREDQIRFWSAVRLPIVALIDTGGKSVHAWIDVQKLATVTTPEQWQSEIKTRLYDRIFTPLGIDPACSNPARLSRLPGHYRTEKGAYQRLLWLSPEGRPIC